MGELSRRGVLVGASATAAATAMPRVAKGDCLTIKHIRVAKEMAKLATKCHPVPRQSRAIFR